MSRAPQHVPSPCVNVCALDARTGWCRGCFRTLDEIAEWIEMTPEDKLATLERVAARRAGVQGTEPGTPS